MTAKDYKKSTPGYRTIRDLGSPHIPGSVTLIRKGSKADVQHFLPSSQEAEKSYLSTRSPGTARSIARKVGADVTSTFAKTQAVTGRFLDTSTAFSDMKKDRVRERAIRKRR